MWRKGGELWEAAKQTQQHLLERTVMQHTVHEEGGEGQKSEKFPPLPNQRKHARVRD